MSDRKYLFVYASSYEHKVLEIETDEDPPQPGDYVQLPLGKNREMCRYRVVDIYFTIDEQGQITYYIEVKPV